MAIPILKNWHEYFTEHPDEGLGSSYERIVLNKKLHEIIQKYNCETVLEVPTFGFTGISGINSMELAKEGLEVFLIDNHKERIELVRNVWEQVGLHADFLFQENFEKLGFLNNTFDLTWNFSSLWFVNDLNEFLSELARVTKKVIFICVPNRSGFGYLQQKYSSLQELKKHLKERNIIPKNIKKTMKKLNWKLVERNYIDAPPWPDIGMNKEKFLASLHLSFLLNKKQKEDADKLCILDYYSGKNNTFPTDMLKHYWFERIAPKFIKFFWAHHKFLLFVNNDTSENSNPETP
ncbi:MAG: class I SAM-dependent methyltransferase [Candidatus Cloacimonetes bacterium]|nr:class I SAM-dependent methyltransferase [Candidatus Cloacimonadota bacterium]